MREILYTSIQQLRKILFPKDMAYEGGKPSQSGKVQKPISIGVLVILIHEVELRAQAQ